MSYSKRDIKEIVGLSGKDINDNFHHIGVGGEWYEVYRLKPTLWRIEQYGEFLFNIRAGTLRIVFDILSRIGHTEYKKDTDKRNEIYKSEKNYIEECIKIYDAETPTKEDLKFMREIFLTDKYIDKGISLDVKNKLNSVNKK